MAGRLMLPFLFVLGSSLCSLGSFQQYYKKVRFNSILGGWKPAFSSSTAQGHRVDTPMYGNDQACFSTDPSQGHREDQYWAVDLESPVTIHKITITACENDPQAINGVRVLVDGQLVGQVSGVSSSSRMTTIRGSLPRSGQKVRLSKTLGPGTALSVARVDIWGCRAGWYGQNCSQRCSSGCQDSACNTTDGQCAPCREGWRNDRCSDFNECQSTPCKNGGQCQDGVNSYTCVCRPGFTGTHCEQDFSECQSTPCKNGGQCQDGVNSYTCVCRPGFTGTRCEQDINECQSATCKNGGQCLDGVNSYMCVCRSGFNGTHCEQEIDECRSAPCKNGGQCQDGVNSYTCICRPGFNGTHCEQDYNQCRSAPCKNGGQCQDGVSSYTCICRPGFNGTHCEQDYNQCRSAPCKNGGQCQDGVNSYTCICRPGFNGTHCEQDNNQCQSAPCKNGGQCQDGVSSYTCVCRPGFNGTHCEQEIDECQPDPCKNGGQCQDGVSSYTCVCRPGFTGTHCEQGLAVSTGGTVWASIIIPVVLGALLLAVVAVVAVVVCRRRGRGTSCTSGTGEELERETINLTGEQETSDQNTGRPQQPLPPLPGQQQQEEEEEDHYSEINPVPDHHYLECIPDPAVSQPAAAAALAAPPPVEVRGVRGSEQPQRPWREQPLRGGGATPEHIPLKRYVTPKGLVSAPDPDPDPGGPQHKLSAEKTAAQRDLQTHLIQPDARGQQACTQTTLPGRGDHSVGPPEVLLPLGTNAGMSPTERALQAEEGGGGEQRSAHPPPGLGPSFSSAQETRSSETPERVYDDGYEVPLPAPAHPPPGLGPSFSSAQETRSSETPERVYDDCYEAPLPAPAHPPPGLGPSFSSAHETHGSESPERVYDDCYEAPLPAAGQESRIPEMEETTSTFPPLGVASVLSSSSPPERTDAENSYENGEWALIGSNYDRPEVYVNMTQEPQLYEVMLPPSDDHSEN
ncbi:uncharacterized protein LOC143295987 [Babylonia areolata]|uniref:uncharacterized protein LOC143295987 n=1 Tax=Babylonia areolata TaxID=304850 RepID=UPI003FCF8A41